MPKFSKLSWHKRTHGHEFTGAEFRVLMSIFDHSDECGRRSHPGIKLLIEETGYGKAAISKALTALQDRGWITRTRKGSGVSGHTSLFELVPDAPKPPSWSTGVDQPDAGSRSAGVDQPTGVGLLEETSWSTGVDQVGLLEWTPTDPDIRSGSDPFGSDQEEVRYPPNHLEDHVETGLESRSLAVAGSESTEETEGAREAPEGLVGIRPATERVIHDDPFSEESLRQHAERAAELAALEERQEPRRLVDISSRHFKDAYDPFADQPANQRGSA